MMKEWGSDHTKSYGQCLVLIKMGLPKAGALLLHRISIACCMNLRKLSYFD
jgi:hypothetical protein